MKAGAAWAGAIGAGAVAWFASTELEWPARLLAAVLLGPLPMLFMMQAGAVDSYPRPVPRIPVYFGSIVALWLLSAVAVAAAAASGFSRSTLGLIITSPLSLALWTTGATLASGALVALFRAMGAEEAEIMREIAPVTPLEKLVFVGLAVSAGICEELTFRGFLLPALSVATGSTVVAVALSSMAFGVMHAHQRAAGALRAVLLGALLAIPVLVTGSVYPSMIAHALIDILGGLWLARWLFR